MFSFNHKILLLSTIVSMLVLSYSFCYYQPYLYSLSHRNIRISSFILLYSFNTLFAEKILPWLVYELIKLLENTASIVLNSSFPSNTILSLFFSFLFFLMIGLYFLILAVIAQSFIPTGELVMPTGTQNNEANAEVATQLAII